MNRSTALLPAAVLAAVIGAPGATASPTIARPAPRGERSEAPPSIGNALAPGDKLAPATGTDLDGHAVRLTWTGAKLMLVNLWATWCQPCREEMPELQKLADRHAADGLATLGLVVLDRSSAADVRKAAADAGVRYRVLLGGDSSVVYAFGGIATVPTTYLIDAEGRLVRKYVGTNPDELAVLSRDVDDYLAGRRLGAPYIPQQPAPGKN